MIRTYWPFRFLYWLLASNARTLSIFRVPEDNTIVGLAVVHQNKLNMAYIILHIPAEQARALGKELVSRADLIDIAHPQT